MPDLRYLETPVRHASAYVGFFDGTGYSADDYRPGVNRRLAVRLEQAPRDLELLHKPSGIGVLRRNPDGMTDMVPGRARGGELASPAQGALHLQGVIFDRSGQFNPRAFSLDTDGDNTPWLRIFRSPQGTRRPHAGWLVARLQFADGRAASWAVATCTVSPPFCSPLTFTAQADLHGDLLLPLNRVPAPDKNESDSPYPASFSIQADPAVSGQAVADPESFAECSIAAPADGEWVPSLSLAVKPGADTRISSKDSKSLQLQQD